MHDKRQGEVGLERVGPAGAAEGTGMTWHRPEVAHALKKLQNLTVEHAPTKIAPTGTAVEVVAEEIGQPTSLKGAEVGANRDASGETAVAETAW